MEHLVFIQQNPLPFAALLNGACHRVAPDATAFDIATRASRR
jgi:hypothetical protein